eukprot:Opistho-2@77812
MTSISLKINLVKTNTFKTMQFEGGLTVREVCKDIQNKAGDAGSAADHGLFWPDEDPKKGRWLEPGRTLNYYDLKAGDMLEYKKKHRPLRVKAVDGALKTVLVDDSLTVHELIRTVCEKFGIQNWDEFSLVAEGGIIKEESKQHMSDEEDDQKAKAKDAKRMADLKKKLHTDDEIAWLNHDKTLREQGVDETQVLILRKKFFFSDGNVDRNDPVQLNLLFVQTRDAILNGTHPVTEDEAVQMAAYICQINMGDHDPAKHRAGAVKLEELLPEEYRKVKGIEKRFFDEHRKLVAMTELNAKYRFIQLCRSLKTYGVTFFLVKEKEKGKNKLVPRLLGITRDSVMRVNEVTKEVIKTWPLTTIRRWAASPNSFTLDFGDYSESFYSVQTTEGEAISQLVAGYIDIIVKKKKDSDRKVNDDDDEMAVYEDSVGAARATAIQHLPSNMGYASEGGVALPGVVGRAGAGTAQLGRVGAQQLQYHNASVGQAGAVSGQGQIAGLSMAESGLGQAQRALMGNITNGFAAVTAATSELGVAASLPPLGTDPASIAWRQQTLEVAKQNVSSQLSAMTAATASVVTLTSGDPSTVDHTAVSSAVTTISTNLTELSKNAKMMAALVGDPALGDKVLEAARGLAGATGKLLTAVQTGTAESRMDLLNAAQAIGVSSSQLLAYMGEPDVDAAAQEELINMAKAVAAATTAMVTNAKNVAAKCDDPNLQNGVITATKGAAMSTQQLVACTKVVAPTINSPLCQDQLVEAVKFVGSSIDSLLSASEQGCRDEAVKSSLKSSAQVVREALEKLIEKSKEGGRSKGPSNDYEDACDLILATTEKLFGSMGNAAEMVKHAKALAQATSQLVNCIKGEAANERDPEAQKRLLAAAKSLADATAKLVLAAKDAATNPTDAAYQAKLRQAAEELRSATNAAASHAMKKKVLKKLEHAAKQTAAVTTQLIAASHGAASSNRNPASQQQLANSGKEMTEKIGRLINAVREHASNPDNASAQLDLINSAKEVLAPGAKLVAAAKAASPTVGDGGVALALNNFSKAATQALQDLKDAQAVASDACGSLEIDSAIQAVKQLGRDLGTAREAASAGKLMPLPGETAESCANELGATSKTVGSSMAQLLTAANQGNENYTGVAARDTSAALKILANAVRGVAATSKEKDVQDQILQAAQVVMDESARLIGEAKSAIGTGSNDPNKMQRLTNVAKAVSGALNQVVNCLPGQRDVDNCIKAIAKTTALLDAGSFPAGSGADFNSTQQSLTNAAAALSVCSNELLAASRGSPEELAAAARKFEKQHGELISVGMKLAGLTKDKAAQQELVTNLKGVSATSTKLLLSAKSMAADPNAPNIKNQLAMSARGVVDSINALLNVCSTAAPGQKECDNAIRNIQAAAQQLENPSEPVNEGSYFECLDSVMDKSRSLAQAIAQINSHSRAGDGDKIGESVTDASAAVTALTEAAAQAAYLVGVSDPYSTPAVPGLVDQNMFARALQGITDACDALLTPDATQQKILTSATVIAKHTSALCNACKAASTKTTNPVAKQQFVNFAKNVASTTAALVTDIKSLAGSLTDDNRAKCATTTKPLIEAVQSLVTYASSPEFASVPAKISPEARAAQQPLCGAGKGVIASSVLLLTSAKALAGNPKDASSQQLLLQHSKAVSEAIKALANGIKDHAPGQKECDEAISTISRALNDVDQASLAATVGSLPPREDSTLQGFQEQLVHSLKEIKDIVPKVSSAAKGEPQSLGHAVVAIANQFVPFVNAAVGAASRTTDKAKAEAMFDMVKTITESAMQLMYSAKESGGNQKAVGAHAKVDENVNDINEGIKDLFHTLETSKSDGDVSSTIMMEIQKATASVGSADQSTSLSFKQLQENILEEAKNLGRHAAKAVALSRTQPEDLLRNARDIAHSYAGVAAASRGILALTDNEEVRTSVETTVRDLGPACSQLAQSCATVQSSPENQATKKQLSDDARVVSERVAKVMAAVRASAKGVQACEQAMTAVVSLLGDLETMAMFANAGSLNPEDPKDTFNAHKEEILRMAKQLVDCTKNVAAGAAGSQEQLAAAAKGSVEAITRLAEACKLGATAITSNDINAQELLLNAIKDVASALNDLLGASKSASGQPVNDPSMDALKETARTLVSGISQLLKVVKSVEDETARGARAIESAMEGIVQEVKALESSDPPKRQATPEELVNITKAVTMSTAKMVAAGTSGKQEEIVGAANMARKAMVDLLQIAKGCASKPDVTSDQRSRVHETAKKAALEQKTLLQAVYQTLQGDKSAAAAKKQEVTESSKKVAGAVSAIVDVAKSLKGDWVDPDDPSVIAENELLAAAAAIEAAAKKLSELKPRERPREANEDLNFEEQILEAAKAIAAATSALVKAATVAQRELVQQGKVAITKGTAKYHEDAMWSDGLVSAAKGVAGATGALCEAANSAVQGDASQERLVSAAKSVAASTAQLVVACRVKAEPNSQAQSRLNTAASAVKRATDSLVTAASDAAVFQEQDVNVTVDQRFVGSIAAEMGAYEEILRKEKELEDARKKLAKLRQQKYQK